MEGSEARGLVATGFGYDGMGLLWYYGAGLGDRRSLQADERGSITSVVDAGGTLIGINSYDECGIRGGAKLVRYGYTGQGLILEA